MAKRKRMNLGVVVDGTTYDDAAPREVVAILERARKAGKRICWRYGNPVTGRAWEEPRICGTIGRSKGTVKVPPHATTRRGRQDVKVLATNIVRIYDADTGKSIYQHPGYHAPK